MKMVVYRVVDETRNEYELFADFVEASKRHDRLRRSRINTRLERKEINIDTKNWLLIGH